jgi:beta-lactam-binding protein with PASTA domain
MGAGRYPSGASDEAADSPTDEQTLAGEEEWRVAEQYRTEPVEPADRPVDDGDTIVLEQDVPPEPPRRFPPDLGPGLLAALLGVLLMVILVPTGLWLASRDDDTAATETNTFDTGPETLPPTTTPTAPAQRRVPDLVGRQVAEARELLANGDLRVGVRRIESERPRGEVVAQEPSAGAEIEVDAEVVLTVSGGVQRIAVPDVVGIAATDAIEVLEDAGLTVQTRLVPADEPDGTVVAQVPAAGDEVVPETEVVLDVAEPSADEPPPTTTEPATVRVPSVVGLRAAAARERLRALGLRPTQRPVQSSRPAGEVVRQSPGAGAELREGGIVTLRVSTGPATIAVPDVVGLSESAAIRDLESAGFVVSVVDEPTVEPTEDGFVLRQNPLGGASRRKGATVTITVARFT